LAGKISSFQKIKRTRTNGIPKIGVRTKMGKISYRKGKRKIT